MNKVAIVTAASRGMGAAAARRLSKDGFKLVLLSRSDTLEPLAKELDAIAFRGSVNSDNDLKNLIDLTISNFGRIDVVVNNTGHSAKGDLLKISDQEWTEGFDLLFMNVVRICRYLTPIMEKQGSGSIINISTFAAVEPSLDFPVSSAIRAGLAAYVKLYSDRYAPSGIRMNNILPGFIDSYEISDEVRERIPIKRSGSVDEIAGVISFLASNDSKYITGENIKVDGGLSRSI